MVLSIRFLAILQGQTMDSVHAAILTLHQSLRVLGRRNVKKIARTLDGAPDEAKVFLSYSRRDRERAQGIANALRSRHFGVFKDTDDILPTEEWKYRLEQLIEEADTIVFLLSPHSAASEVCAWEVEYAHSLSKRIAPIVIEETEPQDIPPLLAQLNFIFCTPRDPFENAVNTLASALVTDIDWIREHTRLAGLASRWDKAGRPARLLLRGQDIADAEAWRDSHPSDAPAVTTLQAVFVGESRKAAIRRQRSWIGGSLGVAAAAATLAVFAYFQAVEADNQRTIAEANATEADRQRVAAEQSEALARTTRDDAWLTQSAILTDWANEASLAGDDMTAALLLLAALPDEAAASYRTDAERPLAPKTADAFLANYFYGQEAARLEQNAPYGVSRSGVNDVEFDVKGERVFTVSNVEGEGATLTVWRAADGAFLRQFTYPDNSIDAIAIHPERDALVAILDGRVAALIDPQSGEEIRRYDPCEGARLYMTVKQDIVFSVDGRYFATAGTMLCVWDEASGAVASRVGSNDRNRTLRGLTFLGTGKHIAFSDGRAVLAHVITDGRTLLIYRGTGTVRAKGNARANRLIITDTGTGVLAPGARRPNDYVWPSTQLWDLATVKSIATLNDRQALRGASFSDDGARIVAPQENRLRVWDSATGEEISTRSDLSVAEQYFAQDSSFLRTAQFAPGSTFITSSDSANLNKLWNENGDVVDMFGQHWGPSNFHPTLAPSPANDAAVEYIYGELATLWKMGTARSLHPIAFHFETGGDGPVGETALAEIQAYFRQRSESKFQGGDWPNGAAPEETSITAPNGKGSGKRAARWSRAQDMMVEVLDSNGTQITQLGGHDAPVLSVAFRPRTDEIVTTTRAGIRLFDASSGAELWRMETADLTGRAYRHRTAVFSDDGQRLFVLGEDFVDVLDMAERRKIASFMSEDAIWNDTTPAAYYEQGGPMMFEALKANFTPRAWTHNKDDLAPRFWQIYSSVQAMVDVQKASATRCLTPHQLKTYYLGRTPPRWCITGPGLETDPDPANWRPLRPYHEEKWRDWQVAHDNDPSTPPPE